MIKILFICHGNICRSPMAEFVMKYLVDNENLNNEIYIESAAVSREEIGNGIHPGTKKKLKEMKIPFDNHRARQVTLSDYDYFDYLIVMDDGNILNLLRIIKEDQENKVFKLLDFTDRKGQNIADPWYTGNFDETYDDVLEGCQGLLSLLKKDLDKATVLI